MPAWFTSLSAVAVTGSAVAIFAVAAGVGAADVVAPAVRPWSTGCKRPRDHARNIIRATVRARQLMSGFHWKSFYSVFE